MTDHPLNNSSKSDWGRYFLDQALWIEIEKDIKRTRNDMEFFTSSKDPKFKSLKDQLKKQAKTKKADLSGNERIHYIETHADVISKILFIYAKLNAGVKYV